MASMARTIEPPTGGAVEIHRLSPSRWDDLEALFGPSGACSGCWCMWWRITAAEFDRRHGDELRGRLHDLVVADRPTGLLAYLDGSAVGWVSVAPRSEFGRLQRSPKLRPVDDEPVWSIVCFFVERAHRDQGVARALLEEAVAEAARHGAGAVEGYPIDTTAGPRPAPSVFTGTLGLFEQAGFTEVARRGGRPIVRRTIAPGAAQSSTKT